MGKRTTTKDITTTGIGIALFVALSFVIRVPVFENYYICLGYVVMAVYLYSVGTIHGTLVGTFGVFIYCLLISGLRGMPGWILANVVIGIILGYAMEKTKTMDNKKAAMAIHIIAIVISVAVGILVIKSGVECFLYGQPFWLRTANNIYAFVADIVTVILSLPFCYMLDSRIKKIVNGQ